MRVVQVGGAVLAGGLVAGWWLQDRTPAAGPVVGEHPAPTEIASEQDEEEANEARREWLERVHRAPPGLDWRALEEQNVRDLVARRRERAAPLGQWVERGSDNQAGSMFTVDRTADGARLYAGSAFGGLWRGNVDGTGWTPIGDGNYGGVHHLVVLPGAPEVLLTSPTWGQLVYRSADDGATWSPPAGLSASLAGVRRLVADPSGVVWLVAVDDQTRLYRSTDRGASFERVLDLGYGWGDVWVPREGAAAVYAFGDALYVSTDGGETFDARPTPEAAWYARIAGSEATNPPTLYIVPDQDEIYRSVDGGESWQQRGVVSDYWDLLTASIRDPNLVAWGGVDLHVSRNGGQSSASPNTWDEYYADPAHKLHADIMAVTVEPDLAGETWYVGCHGGVYQSFDGLLTNHNLSLAGLRVSQYYAVHTSRTDASSVMAGAQDQGFQHAPVAPEVGEERFDFVQVLSGDYGHLVSTDGSHDSWVFSVYPGFIFACRANPLAFEYIYFPPDLVAPAWMPFLAPDPQGNPEAFLYAGAQLWRFERVGPYTWVPEPLSDRVFSEADDESLSAVAFSPLDPQRALAITNQGRVFRSDSGGARWSETGTGPAAHYFYGTAIVASGREVGRFYLGGSGYDGPAVYLTTDGGETLVPWGEGLPPTLVYSLTELRDGTGRVVAGTENTAYVRGPDDPAWVDAVGDAAPITTYWAAETLTDENTVRFGTYGRGIWDLRLDPQGDGCFASLDADSDGVVCEFDCADDDAQVFPGATDACDGVDGDCDGTAERDLDGDGFLACAECDDTSPIAHPGAIDVQCNGVDEDCDGADTCGKPGCGCASGRSADGLTALLVAVATLRWARRSRRTAGGRR